MSRCDVCISTVFLIAAPGDLLPVWTAYAEAQGVAIDWRGWELTLELSGPVTVTRTASGNALGVITYAWVAGDTDVPGDYEVTLHGLSPEGKPQTFIVDGIVRIGAR